VGHCRVLPFEHGQERVIERRSKHENVCVCEREKKTSPLLLC
jgi:hypothetical protein